MATNSHKGFLYNPENVEVYKNKKNHPSQDLCLTYASAEDLSTRYSAKDLNQLLHRLADKFISDEEEKQATKDLGDTTISSKKPKLFICERIFQIMSENAVLDEEQQVEATAVKEKKEKKERVKKEKVAEPKVELFTFINSTITPGLTVCTHHEQIWKLLADTYEEGEDFDWKHFQQTQEENGFVFHYSQYAKRSLRSMGIITERGNWTLKIPFSC